MQENRVTKEALITEKGAVIAVMPGWDLQYLSHCNSAAALTM